MLSRGDPRGYSGQPSDISDFRDVQTGQAFTCGLRVTGDVLCWGTSSCVLLKMSLAYSFARSFVNNAAAASLGRVVAIFAGHASKALCGITEAGEVWHFVHACRSALVAIFRVFVLECTRACPAKQGLPSSQFAKLAVVVSLMAFDARRPAPPSLGFGVAQIAVSPNDIAWQRADRSFASVSTWTPLVSP